MSLDTYESIFQQFPAVTSEEWKNKIIKDLKGEPFDKLIWHSKEDIDVLPFYTKEDSEQYRLNIPIKGTKAWQVTERILVNDIASANKEALLALQYGATALAFDLQNKMLAKEEIEELLTDILLEVVTASFENYDAGNKVVLEDTVKNSCGAVVKISEQEKITDELVFALQQGLLQPSGNISFHFFISRNYFFEIAKLRAFRWLWKQVCELNQLSNANIFIQSETSKLSFNKEEENGNILRNTTEAMSAILGGCDSLIINNHDALNKNTAFGKRIARNIHHILHYESYFNDIEDAVKGSYYIEYLTYQLCKNTWEKLRKL